MDECRHSKFAAQINLTTTSQLMMNYPKWVVVRVMWPSFLNLKTCCIFL